MPVKTSTNNHHTARITGANPGQALRRLAELQQTAGSTSFERARLVSELLDNRQWLAAKFADDEAEAGEWLQEKYLPDLAGYTTVWILRDVYRWQPEETYWAEHKYNLPIIEKHWRDETQAKPEKGMRQRVTLAQLEEVQKDLAYARKACEAKTKEVLDRDGIIADLRREISRLEQALARAEGRVEALEQQLHRRAAS